MGDFLYENLPLIAGIIAGGIAILLLQIFTVKGRVKRMDQKRITAGKPALTEEEKEMVTGARRAETIETALIYMIALIVALGIGHFF